MRTPNLSIDARSHGVQNSIRRAGLAAILLAAALLASTLAGCVAGEGGANGQDLSFGGDGKVVYGENGGNGDTNFPVWSEAPPRDSEEEERSEDPGDPRRAVPDGADKVPGVNLGDKARAADGSNPDDPAGEIDTSEKGEAPQPPPESGPPAPQPPPVEKGCQSHEDCPVVANGCILQQCTVDASGKGTCSDAAFVCECIPGFDAQCDDNDSCSTDTCQQDGTCAHKDAGGCDDGNPCTADSCAASACIHQAFAEGDACEDGNICTIDQVCTAGACAGGGIVDCDDGDACTFDLCDPVGGCQHKANGACNG